MELQQGTYLFIYILRSMPSGPEEQQNFSKDAENLSDAARRRRNRRQTMKTEEAKPPMLKSLRNFVLNRVKFHQRKIYNFAHSARQTEGHNPSHSDCSSRSCVVVIAMKQKKKRTK